MPEYPTLRVALLALALCTGIQTPSSAQDCFNRSDNRRLKFDILQISTPPIYEPKLREEEQQSPYYPGTDFASTSIGVLQRATPAMAGGQPTRQYFLLWANRCVFLPGITKSVEECRNTKSGKGNSYPGIIGEGRPLNEQLRAGFSSYDKADTCTLINAGSAIGKDWSQLTSWADAAGIVLRKNLADKEALATHARTVRLADGTTSNYLLDVCVVDGRQLPSDTKGIALDYEVFDYRSPKEVVHFISRLSSLLREADKDLVLVTNPLPRKANGLDSTNIIEVLKQVSALVVAISTGATEGNPNISYRPRARTISPMDDYRRQLKVLTDDGKHELTREQAGKVFWSISLYDTALSEARALHEEILARKYRGIMIFRHYVKQGGACSRDVNQLTACLAFGECDGNYGLAR